MSRQSIIAELEGYFAGRRIFAIDLVVEAVDLLSKRRRPPRVLLPLRRWLANDEPRLPDDLIADLLSELRRGHRELGGGAGAVHSRRRCGQL